MIGYSTRFMAALWASATLAVASHLDHEAFDLSFELENASHEDVARNIHILSNGAAGIASTRIGTSTAELLKVSRLIKSVILKSEFRSTLALTNLFPLSLSLSFCHTYPMHATSSLCICTLTRACNADASVEGIFRKPGNKKKIDSMDALSAAQLSKLIKADTQYVLSLLSSSAPHALTSIATCMTLRRCSSSSSRRLTASGHRTRL